MLFQMESYGVFMQYNYFPNNTYNNNDNEDGDINKRGNSSILGSVYTWQVGMWSHCNASCGGGADFIVFKTIYNNLNSLSMGENL